MPASPREPPLFRPTASDMKDSFERYVESVEDQLHEFGACRIAPPAQWRARKEGYATLPANLRIEKPIEQHCTGRVGLFRTLLMEGKPMDAQRDFRPMASDPKNCPPPKLVKEGIDALEREFWKKVSYAPPMYGADVPGSIFDKEVTSWNVAKLDTVLSRTLAANEVELPGVNQPYLYFGMWRALFAWHTEDMDLYSINYLHHGAPKVWYIIAPEHRARFERVAQSFCPELHRDCSEFLRHKEILISPQILKQHNVPYMRMVQHPGEFVVTFPGAYHAGFSTGFNVAESTNFATRRWVGIGACAGACECSDDSVRIDMRMFGVEPRKPGSAPPPATKGRTGRKKGVLEASMELKRRREEMTSERPAAKRAAKPTPRPLSTASPTRTRSSTRRSGRRRQLPT